MAGEEVIYKALLNRKWIVVVDFSYLKIACTIRSFILLKIIFVKIEANKSFNFSALINIIPQRLK